MNKDVKIGGLFLHEIKFREKGKVNEMQHDGKDNEVLNKSSEIAIKSNSRGIEQEVKKPVQKHQATHMNREIGSQTPPLPQLVHSKKMFSMRKGEANLGAENQIEVSKYLIISKKVLILQMVLLLPSL